MANTLFLGIGGTGSRVIAKLAKELENNHIAINNGAVYCAAMDTHGLDFEYILKTMGVETPIPTVSADSTQTVGDLLRKHPQAREWFVDDTPVMDMEPMYTASSVRMKARLAFTDICESKKIRPLEAMIGEMQRKEGEAVYVVPVSSIENGMLLPTALWLRNQFKARGREIRLCGIFLLPDVFAKTLKDISDDSVMKERLYANAYAAIREINAVSKIKKNPMMKPERPVRLEGFFDGEDMGKPSRSDRDVFDFAFLLDYENKAGMNRSSIAEYEAQAAQFAYMRFCSPIWSVERNYYDRVLAQKGFSFGSFGIEKAVYPKKDVEEYCVLNAIQDAVDGWQRLDFEIGAITAKEKADGTELTNPVEMYTKLFETYLRAKGNQDPFFSSLKEETLKNKAADFLKAMKERIAHAIEARNSDAEGFSALNALGIELENTGMQTYHFVEFSKDLLDSYSIDKLKEIVESNTALFEKEKNLFEKDTLNQQAELTVNEVFPQTVGASDMGNERSVYGMLTLRNEETDERSFVHPITARYLLYRLQAEIKKEIKCANLEKAMVFLRLEHLEDDVYFDYGRTKHKIETMYNYFDAPLHFWEGSADARKQHFIRKYREYIQRQYVYGKEYETWAVYEETLRKLETRVNLLVEKLEAFFAKLPDLSETYAEKIRENLQKTESKGAEITVCASEKAKDHLYRSLNLKLNGSDKGISALVINGIFGMLCAQTISDHPYHAKYAEMDIMQAFSKELFAVYTKKIAETQEEKLDLDIYSALKAEAHSEDKTDYAERLKALTESLRKRAVPCLQYTANENRIETEFWGFHPDALRECPAFDGRFDDMWADAAYPKNELICCSAVYNLNADDFHKLNEREDGVYYRAYRNITEHLNDSTASLLQTPHTDKTWHEILPRLSEKKD